MRPISSIGIGSWSTSPSSTSSPSLNCLRAAARTASFIAEMTSSRSMPFSLHSASMLCPMVALIIFSRQWPVSGWSVSETSDAARPAPLLFSCLLFDCPTRRLFLLRRLQLPLALLGEPELLFHVHFEVRLDDAVERDEDAPAGLVVEHYVVALDADDAPAEVALHAHGPPRLHLRHAAREPLV